MVIECGLNGSGIDGLRLEPTIGTAPKRNSDPSAIARIMHKDSVEAMKAKQMANPNVSNA